MISAQTQLLTEDLTPQRTKAEKPKAKKTQSDDRAARLNSSQASARLQIKQSGKGKQESWTVKTTTKPLTKGSKQTSFRVRVSDVGFRVCLVYYDNDGFRRERYLCYLSASEWKLAKRGSLADFVRIVADKLVERSKKEDADGQKLEKLVNLIEAII